MATQPQPQPQTQSQPPSRPTVLAAGLPVPQSVQLPALPECCTDFPPLSAATWTG